MATVYAVKSLRTLSVCLGLIASTSLAAGAEVRQLTGAVDGYARPQISSSGQVVWAGWDGNDYEIYLWDGAAVQQITRNSGDDHRPQINDAGQVVWEGYGTEPGFTEIFLWSDGVTRQLTNNGPRNDGYPQINVRGEVVWHGEDGDHEIYLWDGVAVQQITDNTEEDRYPQISDDGQVAWLGEDAVRPTVILWNGGVAQKLASSSSKDDRPRMNSAGQVTWQGYVGTDWEIHLWDGSAVRQLTASENGRNEQPHLNDVGHVVWKGPGRVISLWDGSVVRPLTPDARTGYQPRSNNSDEVVWWTEEGSLLQLLLWDGMGTRVIATATSLDPNYQINGDGQVVWVGTIGGNLGLYLYTPDPPAAPLQLTATVDSPTQVTLSWSDASDNETAFQIWRKIGDGEFAPCGESPANTTSAVDATLSPNTHYLYQVRAVGRRAMSDWSNTVEVTTPPPPPGIAPTDLQATTVSARQIRLTWTDNSTDERAFVIWRQAGSGEFKPYRRTRANVTAFLDRNLRPNTTYGYMVRAEHRTAVSDWSDPTSATTLPLPPAKPGAPIAMATSATQIVLRWTDRSSNETEFSIWRQVGTGAFTPYGTVGANEVSFVDPSVLPNTRYRYRVRAVNTGGSSAFSRTATAVTPGSAGTASRTRRLTPAGTSARRSRR